MKETIEEKKKLIKNNFELLEEWEDKYLYLIELGNRLPKFSEKQKKESNRVHGCTSRVWIVGEITGSEKFNFIGDSDSRVVKGLLAILLQIYSGSTARQIKQDESNIVAELNLSGNLVPARISGFEAMQKRIKLLAGS